jgi:WD40 repeat protein
VGHTDFVEPLCFSGDKRYLITGSDDTSTRVWDLSTGQSIMSLSGDGSPIVDVSAALSQPYVAAATSDNSAFVWDIRDGSLVREFSVNSGNLVGVSISSDGTKVFLAVSTAPHVSIRSVSDGQVVRELDNHSSTLTSMAVSRDEDFIAVAYADSTIRTWEAETGTEQRVLRGHSGAINSL